MQTVPSVKQAAPPLNDWLAQYSAAGGVLNYVLFEAVDPAIADRNFHQQTAIAALQDTFPAWNSYLLHTGSFNIPTNPNS